MDNRCKCGALIFRNVLTLEDVLSCRIDPTMRTKFYNLVKSFSCEGEKGCRYLPYEYVIGILQKSVGHIFSNDGSEQVNSARIM